jgi:hypothetical protein
MVYLIAADCLQNGGVCKLQLQSKAKPGNGFKFSPLPQYRKE